MSAERSVTEAQSEVGTCDRADRNEDQRASGGEKQSRGTEHGAGGYGGKTECSRRALEVGEEAKGNRWTA